MPKLEISERQVIELAKQLSPRGEDNASKSIVWKGVGGT